MYVVTVEFTIAASGWDAFLPLMLENASRSRTAEPGCREFDVCVTLSRPLKVFLYEVYDDREAFDDHLASDHFKAFAEATSSMVVGRRIETWDRLEG